MRQLYSTNMSNPQDTSLNEEGKVETSVDSATVWDMCARHVWARTCTLAQTAYNKKNPREEKGNVRAVGEEDQLFTITRNPFVLFEFRTMSRAYIFKLK